VHGRDHRARMFGIHVRVDAVAEVEHVAVAVAETRQHAANFVADNLGRGVERAGSRLPCSATRPAVSSRASARSVVQSTPSASQPVSAMWSSQAPPPLVNSTTGTRRPSRSRVRPSTTRAMYSSENSR
jgi:hypothetical protein